VGHIKDQAELFGRKVMKKFVKIVDNDKEILHFVQDDSDFK
jgi:hypothetical protein